MTAGYKTQAQLEVEREKKRQENEYRPVPNEWRVEQLEKNLSASHDQYLQHLENVRQAELAAKKAEEIKIKLALPPPPPPPEVRPAVPGAKAKFKPLYSQFVKANSSDHDPDNLPNLNVNPWDKFKKN